MNNSMLWLVLNGLLVYQASKKTDFTVYRITGNLQIALYSQKIQKIGPFFSKINFRTLVT